MTSTQSVAPTSPIERVLARIAPRPEVLAALRWGVGRPFDQCPDSWPYVIEVAGSQRWREVPAHVTLGLFALHHQSQSPGAMSKEGWGLGRAVRTLRSRRGATGSSEEGIERRFRAALASDSLDALAVHLRGLVTMLRAADIPLDYARLYRDLCSWPYTDGRERVCLSWARDYFVTKPEEDEEDDQ